MIEKRWMEDHGQGMIFATIGGKRVRLKVTQGQLERFMAASKDESATADGGEPKTIGDVLQRRHLSNLDIALIALNPDPNKLEWSRDDIERALDVPAVALLVKVWLKMLFEPTLEADPTLAPNQGGR